MLAVRSGFVNSLKGISGARATRVSITPNSAEQDQAEDDRADRVKRVPALQAGFHDAEHEHHLTDRQRERAGEVEARAILAPCGVLTPRRMPRALRRSRSEG